ncbi:hypothetical protein RchiOBHm_Chr2g0157041 [Rosa chinensis]|uniref:Uncharacterized protein n=1 Tax=Rosa chinensis TaxID=74649 RepID=A0A2P6S1M1_ROSCH|nr:hypothetical protein RchiOBHm_Chr2g0157041 [Rosa chinensis]
MLQIGLRWWEWRWCSTAWVEGGSERRRGSKLTGPESEGTSTWLILIRASIEFAEDSPLCTEPIPRWSIQETGLRTRIPKMYGQKCEFLVLVFLLGKASAQLVWIYFLGKKMKNRIGSWYFCELLFNL